MVSVILIKSVIFFKIPSSKVFLVVTLPFFLAGYDECFGAAYLPNTSHDLLQLSLVCKWAALSSRNTKLLIVIPEYSSDLQCRACDDPALQWAGLSTILQR